jgi:hypothetical protein
VNNRDRAYTETQIASRGIFYIHAVVGLFCCCWGPAVVQIPSVPGVSTVVVVSSVVGFSSVVEIPAVAVAGVLAAFVFMMYCIVHT